MRRELQATYERSEAGDAPAAGLSRLAHGAAVSRPRYVRSVFSNWAREFASVVSGFVLPRVIDQSIGTVELGIWDFGWSMRSIVSMSALGMGSSVGHYVSRYRVQEDWVGLNRILSSTLALVLYTVVLGMLITIGATVAAGYFVEAESASLVTSARILVAAMGLAACLQIVTQIWGGVLVGSHRFDLLSAIEIPEHLGTMAALIIVVLAGWGLKMMALCVVGRELFGITAKCIMARRICPQLRLRPRWRDWTVFRELMAYGSKTITEALGVVTLAQGAVLILMSFHGAAAVALYSRSRALITFSTRFLMGFARVLVPRAGELREQKSSEQLGRFLITSTKYGLCLALPIVAVLVVMGRPLLHLWMGAHYADPTVLIILALGSAPYFAQRPTWHVLLGIGSHGIPSIAMFIAGLTSVAIAAWLIGGQGWGPAGAAVAVAVPLALSNLVVFPYVGCRATGASGWRYFVEGVVPPCLACLPFVAVITVARLLLPDDLIVSLVAGAGVGTPVLLFTYWRTIVPDDSKRQATLRTAVWLRALPGGRWIRG